MTKNALAVLALSASVFGSLVGLASVASASPSVTMTVDGRDYPVCSMEDCSDQPGQVGIWVNDGRSWLIVGDQTYAITR